MTLIADRPEDEHENCGVGMARRTLLRGALGALPAAAALGLLARSRPGWAQPQQPQTPQEALQELRAGNQRFTTKQPRVRTTSEIEEIWTHTSATQTPFATVLGCADSRLAPELIFDQFIGDLFVVREAGNIANSPTNLGSLEFGQAVLGSKLILVLGHTSCGAIKAAFSGAKPGGNIQSIVDAITPGIAGATTLDDAIDKNVTAVIASIRANSPLLRQAETDHKIAIAGGVYDISTGTVRFAA